VLVDFIKVVLLLLVSKRQSAIKASTNCFDCKQVVYQNVAAQQLMNAFKMSVDIYEGGWLAGDRATSLINERRKRRETRNQLFHLRWSGGRRQGSMHAADSAASFN